MLTLCVTVLLLASTALAQNMSINATGTPPDSSAMLDVSDTSRGFLMPRLSNAQMNAVTNPAEGLLIYNTDSNDFYFFDGLAWSQISIGAISNLAATNWQSYTPTFIGFGTVSNVEAEWRRDGSDVLIRGKVTIGTTTGTEARASLPTGLTSASSSIIPTLRPAGNALTSYFSGTAFMVATLMEPSVPYFTFGRGTSTTGAFAKQNGDQFPNFSTISFDVRIPIQGWSVFVNGSSNGIPSLDSVLAAGNNGSGDSILNVGAIGIGTSTPTRPLTVHGTQQIGLFKSDSLWAAVDVLGASGEAAIRLGDTTSVRSGIRWDPSTDAQHLFIFDGGSNNPGIYQSKYGSVSINTSGIDTAYELYVHRPADVYDFGPGRSTIYAYRGGNSNPSDGGLDWYPEDVDAAIHGYSYWGNYYTAGVYGSNYGDYQFTAGVLGYMESNDYWGALAYRDGDSLEWGLYTPFQAYFGDSITIQDGSEGSGKVLTSDANGKASWQSASGDNLGNHTAIQNLALDTFWLSPDGSNTGISVSSDGGVGMGTKANTGDVRLDIYRPTNNAEINLETGGNNDVIMHWRNLNEHWTLGNTGSNKKFRITDIGRSREVMTIDTFGHVGIGTTTPNELLDIRSSATTTSASVILSNSNQSHLLNLNSGNSSTDPYISWDQSDDLVFATNLSSFTERMRLTSAGRLGIGTASPQSELHVNSASTTTSTIRLTNTATVSLGLWIQSNNTQAGIMNYENTSMNFGTNGANRMTITNTGRVGIGTTNPSSPLHVVPGSTGSFQNSGIYVNNTVASSSANAFITARTESAGGTPSFSLDINTRGGYSMAMSQSDTNLHFYALPTATGSPIMTMTLDKEVGIGTTNPSHKLQVLKGGSGVRVGSGNAGDVFLSGFADFGGTLSANAHSDGTTWNRINTTYAAYMVDIGVSNDYIDFARSAPAANPISNFTSIMRLSSNGNVGIGTTSPSSKLDVSGSVEVGSTDAYYLGDPTTNGTWRIIRSGNNLNFERRESGVWVTKTAIVP